MKILLVQENKRRAELLQRALREAEHVTEIMYDCDEAIDSVASLNFALIILDWVLPGMDGLSICSKLRELGARAPILMLSDRTEVSDRIRGLDAGADDYLVMPFNLDELCARVRALGRRAAEKAGRVRLGHLVLDRVEWRASLNGQAVELTPREFALLNYLARESGRVVSRVELLRRVWDTSVLSCSNVVAVHVKKLRDKLGDYANLIETVRGVGYRIASATESPLY
jgi:two-component system OmpR family response regulator